MTFAKFVKIFNDKEIMVHIN